MRYPTNGNTLSLAVAPSHPHARAGQDAPELDASGSATTALQGESPAMSQLRSQIQRVAPYFRTALLTGERGCGEEAIARALHELSPMAHRPFVVLTPNEAELRFGNTTLVDSLSASAASDGMIYIPHPERLPRSAQFALQRLLRSRSFQPPRIVAFAERGLRSLVSSGSLSSELAESLAALRITIPALRDRREDIPTLLATRIQALSPTPPHLTPELLDAASKLPWPNNFIQLDEVARQLLDLNPTGPLLAENLHTVYGAMPQTMPSDRREIRMVRLDQVLQEHIRAVLFACNGNKLRAAEVLGISRSTLYRMLDAASPDLALQLAS